MSIKVGDSLPDAVFTVMTPDGPRTRTTADIFKNRKIILFGVPGAFTPTCSMNHLPGFRDNEANFKAKGIDEIVVVSVNDVFVMNAWAKQSGAEGKITFLADGSAAFAKAIGLTADLSDHGLGVRSARYSMLVNDGIVEKLNVEPSVGKADVSGADALLGQI
ncbi:MAG: peroxiredoxin [Beijerinckiaceae bacterium]|nr:MAG: peroxiredoxin [Beijerinckiaceae bacterium]